MANMKKGRFDWFDLMTTDVGAAKSFYTQVVGWKTQKWEHGDYEFWTAEDKALGGMMPLPDAAKKMGMPPHWLAYTETDDVDGLVKKAEKLGGKVHTPPTPIPTVGRFAILADPQGAVFAVIQPETPMEDSPRKAGFFSWHELNTTDYKSAWKFYSELFDWKHTSSMDMGQDMGQYWMFGLDAQNSLGGMSDVAKQMKMPPHWLHYVTVEDIDAAVERTQKHGGKLLNGPMDVPGGDKIAQCMDPQGALFALHAPAKN
jgi:predicted enzyme related to lactoylglutathione lyase